MAAFASCQLMPVTGATASSHNTPTPVVWMQTNTNEDSTRRTQGRRVLLHRAPETAYRSNTRRIDFPQPRDISTPLIYVFAPEHEERTIRPDSRPVLS